MSEPVVSASEPEVFPPTLREVMLRPQWILMLLLCLAVAGVFAWLGQWQLSRAVDTAPRETGATEQVMTLEDVVGPGSYLTDPLVGQRVEATGAFVPEDFIVVSSRFNDGEEGFWVTGQLRLDEAEPTSLAVAVGWAKTRAEAEAAASALSRAPVEVREVTGRLIPDEGVVAPGPGVEPTELTRMSPAALLGRWHDVADLEVYRQYLVSDEPLGGLTAIHSPAPDAGSTVNWLNIFYAAEWVIFAGFAFYLWYRLAKDAWEKEIEDLEDAAA